MVSEVVGYLLVKLYWDEIRGRWTRVARRQVVEHSL